MLVEFQFLLKLPIVARIQVRSYLFPALPTTIPMRRLRELGELKDGSEVDFVVGTHLLHYTLAIKRFFILH